jgi:hypothetical protein
LLNTDASDGANGSLFVTNDLCDEIHKDEIIFTELRRHMKEAFGMKRISAASTYVNFITSQDGNLSWPDFDDESFEKVFGPPCVSTIIKIFHASFELVYPYLKRDLFNRVPGKCVKMDGTCHFLAKTKNDKESSEETKFLHVVWNEWGHILSFAFAGSENSQCFQTVNYNIQKRCVRLEKPVENVVAAFSDTCCESRSESSVDRCHLARLY